MLTIDKICHLFAGIIIALTIGLIFTPTIGFGVGVLIGLVKELYDKFIKKTFFDKVDMYVTWLGVLVGYLFLKILL